MKKGQIWSMDLIVGVTIFLIILSIYSIFTANIANSNLGLEDMENDAIKISGILISSGVPVNWTVENYTSVGLTEGNYRMNVDKIHNISSLDYSELKSDLKSQYDFILFFENKNNSVVDIDGVRYIGKPGIDKDNIKEMEKPDDLVTEKRLMIYGSEIVTMVIYLW